MGRRAGVLGLVLMLAAVLPAAGQVVPLDDLDVHQDTLALSQPQPFSLRPFVRPGSETILLNSVLLDSLAYRMDYREGRLWLNAPVVDTTQTLVARYRTWGVGLQDEYVRRRVRQVDDPADSTGAATIIEEQVRDAQAYDPFGGVELQRSGSITRGILAGNNRDVTVESGLNLQLAGEVAEGVRVQAVLTDENTPILPEGNTQRLSEFDRVFIEIEAQQGAAQLGDFDLSFQNSTFARFTRKLQGITVLSRVPSPSSPVFGGGQAAVAGAVSRGIFRTQDITPVDGVQGPYRLEGRNGERFIIVIPASEDVYVNGVRQTRGQTNDYVIDYATGELTFTSNRLLAPDDRVTVEFQYTTNQFTRTVVGTEADAAFWQRSDGSDRARFGVTFLREADSREFSEEFGFTAADDSLLAVSGDAEASRSGAVRVEFDPEAPYVQYTRQDTLLADGTLDTAFVALSRTPAPGEPVYRVRFTRVEPGTGRYVREGRAVNGILYVYRGPGRGEYEPVRILPKPKQQQLLDLRGALEPVPGLEVFGEFARSLNDENRLSPLDDANNTGDAYLSGIRLKPLDVGLLSFSGELRRRFTGIHFASFDRTRPVEFARQWNLDAQQFGSGGGTVQGIDETIDEVEVAVATERSSLVGEVGRIRLGDVFRGIRQAVLLDANEWHFPRVTYRLENIHSDDYVEGEDGHWLRQRLRVAQPLINGRLVPEVEVEQERRRQRVGGDSLASSSLAFVEVRPGLRWQSENVALGGSVELRTEDLWADGALRDGSRSWTVQSDFKVRRGASFNTEGRVGYRVRRYDAFFQVEQQQQNRESVVLNWNGRYRPRRGAANLTWLYEALTERTPKLQEIYIRTGPELGEFVWEDDGDGILELDEFIPERTPDEGTYVRTYIPSDTLAAVISVEAKLSLTLDPARLMTRPSGVWQRILANISTRSSVQVQEKSRDPDLAQIYLLNLSRFRQPGTTLNGILRVGQEVSLFRTNPRYGISLSFNQTRNLNELASGLERRFINQWRLEGTFRPVTQWGLRFVAEQGRNRTESETFASRQFDIASRSAEPEVSYNPSNAVRLSVGGKYQEKRDAARNRSAEIWSVPVTGQYTRAQRLGVNARVEGAHVALGGEAAQGLAQFELTDGNGPGTSFRWTLAGWYQLSQLLRATFSYNARAPSDAPTLHTVRVQLSAVF